MAQCTATAKSTGERCKQPARPGYNVCRFHGAGKKGGPAGGRPPVHGRYSRFIPGDLADRYHKAREDPDLLALRDEIALLDARAQELLGRLTEGGEGALVTSALAAVADARRDLEKALSGEDAEGSIQSLKRNLGAAADALEKANIEGRVWSELSQIWDQRRQLVETERRRLVDLRQVVTAQQAMALVRVVIDVVKQHISDRRTLSAISADIRGYIASGDSGRDRAGAGRGGCADGNGAERPAALEVE